MKMIWHQAPCQNIGIGYYVSFGLLKKKQIVFAIEKKGLRVVPTIKNVINVIWFELHIGWLIFAFKDNILSIRCCTPTDFTLLLSNLLLSRWREVTSSTSELFTCWLFQRSSPADFPGQLVNILLWWNFYWAGDGKSPAQLLRSSLADLDSRQFTCWLSRSAGE